MIFSGGIIKDKMAFGDKLDETGNFAKKTLLTLIKGTKGAINIGTKIGSFAYRGVAKTIDFTSDFYNATKSAKEYDALVAEAEKISLATGVKIHPEEIAKYMAVNAYERAYASETKRKNSAYDTINRFYNPRKPRKSKQQTSQTSNNPNASENYLEGSIISLHQNKDGSYSV